MEYLIIGADVVPTESNQELFISGDVSTLLGSELIDKLFEAKYRIFNLEVPLADTADPIVKGGENLIASTATVSGFKAFRTDILTLANNHILDQGEQGLKSTCNLLDQNGIAYLGVGNTLKEAAKPYIIDWNGKKIGVYACAEHEFSIATEHSAGANPFDPLESPDHVAALKERCDFVIVLYHGGKEYYRYPSPDLQKICRKLVEKGAGLVVCQHTHCIGCEEKYLGGTIVYGQGNFLFDDSDSEFYQTSLLIRLYEDFSISYLPLVKQGNAVRLADNVAAEEIIQQFKNRSQQIKENGFIEKEYTKYAETAVDAYLYILDAPNVFIRVINRLMKYRLASWLMKKKYHKKRLLAIQNYIECEAHRELLLSGVRGRLNHCEKWPKRWGL